MQYLEYSWWFMHEDKMQKAVLTSGLRGMEKWIYKAYPDFCKTDELADHDIMVIAS
jgi:hypothetical protein